MNNNCGCCEGTEAITPISTANRPGLNSLVYRIGTHSTFLETMKANLSNSQYPALANLKTRNSYDAGIAFLDAWAIVADVLTFYQERIANEGYLRTAIERRSILELARLVGYSLRTGVAATVYPAFTMEIGYNKDTQIPAGTKIQSLPASGEMPQFFETSETIEGRTVWNNLQARLTRPHDINWDNAAVIDKIYLQGITTNLKPNDPMLFIFGSGERNQFFRQVKAVEAQNIENRTVVELQIQPQTTVSGDRNNLTPESLVAKIDSSSITSQPKQRCAFDKLGTAKEGIINNLLKPASIPPANASRLGLSLGDTYKCESEIAPQLLKTLKPQLKDTLYIAWQNTPVTDKSPLQSTEALRVKAAPFGANAPLKPVYDEQGRILGYEEWAIAPIITLTINFLINSDNNFEFATVSVRQRTGNQSLSMNREAIRREQRIDESGLSVVPSFILTDSGEFPREIGVTLEILVPLVHIVSVTQESVGWGVVIADDAKRIIASEQTLKYTTEDGRKITITHTGVGRRDELISITEELTVPFSDAQRRILPLDALYDQILPNSWIVVQNPTGQIIAQVKKVESITKAEYGISAKVTQLTLNQEWLNDDDVFLNILRETTVYAQSEELKLAEEVINPKEEPVEGSEIELGQLYEGLQPGRWLIVSGERADLGETKSVKASELVMLLGVQQRAVTKIKNNYQEIPGDITHTFLQLKNPLSYQYKRNTVTIYGNVVKATHGETRTEALGSGDGSKVFQQFPLRQSPLTYVASPTPVGAKSTLEVRVNDILWQETDSLAGLKPSERKYITKTDDDSKTTVIFGNGENGVRLPTGIENVKATYRNGIGKVGNVKAEQINLLASRPLGLKSVINPLTATGGADRESRDQARKNAPLAVMALDRLVSVQDYADFARTFAGIAKAKAMLLSDGRRQVVHLTIAGVDDISIDKQSDLYRNLYQALRQFGDPDQPVRLEVRELMLIILSAKVKILPEYQWEVVEPHVRQALLDTFSFDTRELGQDIILSEVISTIQKVNGVDFVDLDILDTVSETEAVDPEILTRIFTALGKGEVYSRENNNLPKETQPRKRITVNLARVKSKEILPAQIAILTPSQPLTLILNPVLSDN
jgi:predicted phage baseplate assembly protein